MSTSGKFSLVPDLPKELQVEVTGACNLRCRMCLVRYAPPVGRSEGALSYPAFRDLVDTLPELTKLTLQGLGEPLLAPHLLDMIRYATERRVQVGFNSNGVLLNRQWARDLVAAGTSWVHISLDGATASTYEDVRHSTTFKPRPGQFDQVVANLRTLVAERAAAGATKPVIKLVFVAMRRNVAELPALVDLAADVGVDELWVQNLSHTFSDTDPAGHYSAIRAYTAEESLVAAEDQETSRRAFAAAAAKAARRGLDLRLPELTEQQVRDDAVGCTWPWESAYVTHRGEVQPCCMVMGSDRATLGRLDEQPFTEIWKGERYQRFRAGLRSQDPPEVCRGCSLYRSIF
ncbi:SPASM domain-containing protein [Kibdelosporangium persicum]|uniref:Pyrroloquinoline quinone biosynthesis protein PqqE n=1 Tax=Kibdelosporangium persicum TaxID=2698649 RepID=A0ABX2F693_9PSEU|nr:SPASM domain-containing protein [Kibdelosporangium persicum]NRN66878.1 Pyrroloquinoline quinone biosynthesis protein PqqE [Kibdelosporangium persicum]